MKLPTKEQTKEWLKDYQNILLVILILFAISIRFYYFFMTSNQAVWWDEGDYLSVAKGLIHNWQDQEWWSHFTGMRPLLIPLVWAFFFMFNFSEPVIRFFTLLVPSIISVYLVYAIGRDLYDKRIGLISGLMMSIYWVHMFYTFRLLTDIPSILFGLLSIYFFWSWYIKKEKAIGLYLCVLFGVLGFSTRFPLALIPFMCYIYLFITERMQIIRNKTFWKASIFGAIILVVYILLAQIIGSGLANAFQFYFGSSAVSMQTPIFTAFKDIISQIPMFMELVWLIALIIGLFTFFSLFLGFDIFLKQKDKKLNADFFVMLWAISQLILYIVFIKAANDRWLLMLMPPLFFISAKGIIFCYEQCKKYNKAIAVAVLILLVFGGFYQHLQHTDSLIQSKKDTYIEEKLGGLWIKDNFNPDGKTKIMTASVVQIAYYSEGYTYGFSNNDTIWKSCTDIYGSVSTNETCQTETEKAFNKKVKELNPEFMIVHVFEPIFTPQWAYTYAQKYNLTPVQGYVNSNQQPMLIIYKFNN